MTYRRAGLIGRWICCLAVGLGSYASLVAEDVDPTLRLESTVIEQVYGHLQRAQALQRSGLFGEARVELQRAQALAPENAAVAKALLELERMDGRENVPAEEAGSAVALETQLGRVEVRLALQEAELQMQRGDLDRARETLTQAEELLGRFPDSDQAELAAMLRNLVEANEARTVQEREDQARSERQASLALANQMVEIERADQRSVFELRMERILTLKRRGRLESALAQARHLTRDFPRQALAEQLYNDLIEAVHEARRDAVEDNEDFLHLEMNRRIHSALIPEGFDGRPIFPHDWRERDERRLTLDAVAEIPEWQVQINDRLAQKVTVDFDDLDPIEALEFLANSTGVNLVISNEVRTAANPPVALRAGNMRAENVLNWLVRQADTEWRLLNEAVYIGTDQAEDPVLRLYDVTQAVYSAPDLPGPQLGTFSTGDDAGGGFDLFGGGGFDDGDGITPDDLIDLIQTAVAPGEWDNPDYGLEIRNETYLMVTAPPHLHSLIREFLNNQQRLNNTLVHVDLRWLEIQDDYLEEIGVDWRNVADGLLTNTAAGVGNTGAYRQSNIHTAAASLVNRLPGTAMDIAPSLLNSGMNLHLMYLAGTQISAILTAVERKNKGRVLFGAELTCFNGQRAHAVFARQVGFVGSLEVETGGGVDATVGPTVSLLTTGMVLDVQPYVSSDRKYVTMDLRPVRSTVEFYRETLQIAGDNGIAQFPIELPNITIDAVGTRVMIPDKGSIAVGGFTSALEQSSQSVVPVLGHVPYLGRLFGVRGRYSQRSQLILTVTVDIILYEEEEALL